MTDRRRPDDESWDSNKRPVINVSWEDAVAYAKWLSLATGKSYRLLTESEWEYAARSEGKDHVWSGTSDEEELKEYAVYAANSNKRTATVGENAGRKHNALGLYDMSGNVWEWVEDCWHEDYTDAPSDGSAWLEGENGDCGYRVIRGGSWYSKPTNLRSSHRNQGTTGNLYDTVGFRLAQDIP